MMDQAALTDAAGWVAPIATALAAIMTAANLGARVTGWGFVVFAVGSVCWSFVGYASGQTNLLLTNIFLTAVNALGIWRWLGRQARYTDRGERAMAASAGPRRASLVTLSQIVDQRVRGRGGDVVGSVMDGLVACETGRIVAIVVRRGGVGGVGERLIAVKRASIDLCHDHIGLSLDSAELDALPDWVPEAPPAGPARDQKVARSVAP